MTPDYYAVLGVSHDASVDEIRRARNELLKFHPDRNPEHWATEANEKMAAINLAYEVLADPHRKAAYRSLSSRMRQLVLEFSE